jgi:hypothetical protein
MALNRITDKNFLPPEGVKKIPVYSHHFNNSYDAIDRLNTRDHHSMDTSRIIKHPLMAVAVFDVAVNGGATGTRNLNAGVGMIPDNAIVRNVLYDIQTAVVATGATAAISFNLPTDGTLLSIALATGAGGNTGMGLGTPLNSTAGTWIKTTAARGVQIDVTGAGTLTAGKVYCFIEYVVSELDADDYSISL